MLGLTTQPWEHQLLRLPRDPQLGGKATKATQFTVLCVPPPPSPTHSLAVLLQALVTVSLPRAVPVPVPCLLRCRVMRPHYSDQQLKINLDRAGRGRPGGTCTIFSHLSGQKDYRLGVLQQLGDTGAP